MRNLSLLFLFFACCALWFPLACTEESTCKEGESRICYNNLAGCTKTGDTYTCKGLCQTGTESCKDGKWSGFCALEKWPKQEVCDNGQDDDCDGKTDEACGTSDGGPQEFDPDRPPIGLAVKEVLIKAGDFQMGDLDSDPQANPNSQPSHKVTITRDFYMHAYEVKQSEFSALMGYNNASFQKTCGSQCPIENVTWHEALAYANALSHEKRLPVCFSCTGAGQETTCQVLPEYGGKDPKNYYTCPGYRLPTEAEWEFAARGGTTEAQYGTLGSIAWYADNSLLRPHPVGQLVANAFGLYDVLGNVTEWLFDSTLRTYTSNAETDPISFGTDSGSRATRGGGWINAAGSTRVTLRYAYPADKPDVDRGFRLVRTAPAN
ncbi:MAG: SUMF1/EgtB/PvdO family nonheme iron enzyme [Myxococcales bacterium]|nr:SUMF1/EgtB/PvdO family nonheme iron enzyme [Myxococcales bacterium]